MKIRWFGVPAALAATVLLSGFGDAPSAASSCSGQARGAGSASTACSVHDAASARPSDTGALPAPAAGQVLVSGTFRCAACDLKKNEGAASQCGVYGCAFTVHVTRATDHRGRVLARDTGVYHVLDTAASAELRQMANKNRKVRIIGKLYPAERVLEVMHFRFDP